MNTPAPGPRSAEPAGSVSPESHQRVSHQPVSHQPEQV